MLNHGYTALKKRQSFTKTHMSRNCFYVVHLRFIFYIYMQMCLGLDLHKKHADLLVNKAPLRVHAST